jgi:hypothetical protein
MKCTFMVEVVENICDTLIYDMKYIKCDIHEYYNSYKVSTAKIGILISCSNIWKPYSSSGLDLKILSDGL